MLAVFAAGAGFAAPDQAHGFNDEGIQWHSLEDGIDAAVKAKKPILLILHATWCPVCEEYQQLFFDEQVVAALVPYVCVLIDSDKQPDLDDRYAPDGVYVPRTMVLASDGTLIEAMKGPREDYAYFLPPDDPWYLIEYLKRGLNEAPPVGAKRADGWRAFLNWFGSE